MKETVDFKLYSVSDLKKMRPDTIFFEGVIIYTEKHILKMKKDMSVAELLVIFKG